VAQQLDLLSDAIPERQKPIGDRLADADELWSIVCHPAFRLGFLDMQAGRPLDHDAIHSRILRETPPTALDRLGYPMLYMGQRWQDVAQTRYEEGRLAVVQFGLRCKG
jgi:hypothetical protein